MPRLPADNLSVIVVYLKNGEKAPMPDADYVKFEEPAPGRSLLRCYFGSQEVGQFKWEEVAGYTLAPRPEIDPHSSPQAFEAWGMRPPQ